MHSKSTGLFCLLVGLSSMVFGKSVMADDIILMPSAYTLTTGFDAQALQSVQHKPRTVSSLEVGTSAVQLEGSYLYRPSDTRLTYSAQVNALPETFVTPAISFGVRDLGNSAGSFRSDGYYGRGYYLVATKGLDNNLKPPPIHDIILTAGVGAGGIHGVFGGLSFGLPLTLIGTAEYDSRQMNYRVAAPLGKIVSVSYDRLGSGNFIGLELRTPLSF